MSKNTNNAPKFGEDRAYDSNTSPTLQNALANAPVEDIEQKIAQLRQYWVSEENLALFVWANIQTVSSLTNILEDSKGEGQEVPKEVVAIVNDELERVSIQTNLMYVREFRGIVISAANDEDGNSRSYGGTKAA